MALSRAARRRLASGKGGMPRGITSSAGVPAPEARIFLAGEMMTWMSAMEPPVSRAAGLRRAKLRCYTLARFKCQGDDNRRAGRARPPARESVVGARGGLGLPHAPNCRARERGGRANGAGRESGPSETKGADHAEGDQRRKA